MPAPPVPGPAGTAARKCLLTANTAAVAAGTHGGRGDLGHILRKDPEKRGNRGISVFTAHGRAPREPQTSGGGFCSTPFSSAARRVLEHPGSDVSAQALPSFRRAPGSDRRDPKGTFTFKAFASSPFPRKTLLVDLGRLCFQPRPASAGSGAEGTDKQGCLGVGTSWP